MIALLLLLAAPEAVPVPAFQQDAIACVEREAGALAKGNSEPADSVIKAADGQCAAVWAAAERVWLVVEIYGHLDQAAARLDAHRTAYARAFAAVVAARR